jgi:chemotaxis protein CheX
VRSITKSTSPAPVRFDSNWKTILECAALEVFEMMAGTRLELSATPTDEPRGEETAMVGMAGVLCGMTTLRCSGGTAVKLASLMLGGDEASNPSTARDALGELCNMIAGNFKAKVSTLGEHCMLSVPTVISGEDYSLGTAEPSETLRVALTFAGEPIWVSLIVNT